MLKSRLATWILTLGGYVQQRYLDLFYKTEWWAAYEPELWGFWAYALHHSHGSPQRTDPGSIPVAMGAQAMAAPMDPDQTQAAGFTDYLLKTEHIGAQNLWK